MYGVVCYGCTPPVPPAHVDVNCAYALQGVFRRRDHRQAMLHKTEGLSFFFFFFFVISRSACEAERDRVGGDKVTGIVMCGIEGYSFHFGRLTESQNPTASKNNPPSHETGDAMAIVSRG